MNWVSLACFAICIGIFLTVLRPKADFLSPGRLFGFVWSLSIGLTQLKFSALQETWSALSWVLLLTGVSALLIGIFVVYVVHMHSGILTLQQMRSSRERESVHEGRLFVLICLLTAVYAGAYIANYSVRGWLPVDVIGTSISRVDFNVSGLTLFLYTAVPVIFLILLYFLLVRGHTIKKVIMTVFLAVTMLSFFLLLMRYPIILVAVVSFVLLYYATPHIRFRTAFPLIASVAGFFFWISSLRFSHVVSTFLYTTSKMRFPKTYAFFTEPYMYVVTNLENFARSVEQSEYFTYGYFTLDFVTALSGLKYWALEYFQFDRTPYLTSNYNTYTAFWWFYSDFGVFGLAIIPFVLGVVAGMLYYRMRMQPSIMNVTAYGVAVFVMFISYFNFPLSSLWFNLNILLIFLSLRWVILPSGQGVATSV